jgi:amino acid adenylation domain-containing protein
MIENLYPLSHLQEGLYFHWLSAPQSPAYFLQMSYRLKGGLDIDLLRKAYGMLVERHAILRTFFTEEIGSQLLQVVRKEPNPVFIYKEFIDNVEAEVERYKELDRSKGFNLQSGSQMRLSVLSLGDSTYEFVWSHHHIIMDGWCVGILMKEFVQIYSGLSKGKAPSLPKPGLYSSYIDWLTRVDKEKSSAYWRNYLAGFDTVTGLPKKQVTVSDEYLGREYNFRLDTTLRQSVKELCMQSGVTENTFFQILWAVLLSKYNNTKDVIFGSIVSGRPAEVNGIEEMIGLFINTIPVRVQLNEGKSVVDLLKEVQQSSIEGLDYHYAQLAQIQAESELGQGLFDHLIQFQNFPVQEVVKPDPKSKSSGEHLTLMSSGMTGYNTYNFTCLISPQEGLNFTFMYNANCYSDALIIELEERLVRLINGILSNPSTPVNQLDFLSIAEKQQLLETFNNTNNDNFKDKTLLELFEQQAEKTPDHTALVVEGYGLTYKELNERANQLANFLKNEFKVIPDDLIGVMFDKSENLVISILATFKLGACYVPIDPQYPNGRKKFIIEDSGIKVLITKTNYIFDLDYYNGSLIPIDVLLDIRHSSKEPTGISVKPNQLAYIIYTSGSTGQPKGVMVEHAAVANTVQNHLAIFDLKEKDRSLLFASSSFDASITQIFTPLISGGSLYMISDELKKEVNLFEQFIVDNQIDFADIPPAYQKLMNIEHISSLKKLGSGGEAAIPEKVAHFTKYGTYFNAYGPTESAICASMFIGKKGDTFDSTIVPIGKPIQNVQIFLLDQADNLVPIGASGEICIGGAGLARGYLNSPELTAEKFVDNPFLKGEKIYRTGDLGRWLPDGSIEFLGRKDEQVKIRGYRIELGEIEHLLMQHPAITSAVVIAMPDNNGDKELVAYIIAVDSLTLEGVGDYMTKFLPDFMLPSNYILIDELPLTPNGKIDKKHLLKNFGTGIKLDSEYLAPRNETEEKLVLIWQEVLERNNIGIRDDFFKLGGHSIKVVQLISRINAIFMVRIDIQSVFNDPTIENISEQILFIQEQNRQKENVENLVQIKI